MIDKTFSIPGIGYEDISEDVRVNTRCGTNVLVVARCEDTLDVEGFKRQDIVALVSDGDEPLDHPCLIIQLEAVELARTEVLPHIYADCRHAAGAVRFLLLSRDNDLANNKLPAVHIVDGLEAERLYRGAVLFLAEAPPILRHHLRALEELFELIGLLDAAVEAHSFILLVFEAVGNVRDLYKVETRPLRAIHRRHCHREGVECLRDCLLVRHEGREVGGFRAANQSMTQR
jgi:hypothetical protein